MGATGKNKEDEVVTQVPDNNNGTPNTASTDTTEGGINNAQGIWGGQRAAAEATVKALSDAVTAAGANLTTAEKDYNDKYNSAISLRENLVNEQKPQRKEDAEKMARRSAIIKGVGDLLSALTVGIHGYGKNGAGVVPTLSSNSPLKDIDKLNELQAEYLKRKEAWDELVRKTAIDKADSATEQSKYAVDKALAKMASAQEAYNAAVEGLNKINEDETKYYAEMGKIGVKAALDEELEKQKHQNRKEITNIEEAGANARAEKAAEAQKEAQKKAWRNFAQNEFKGDAYHKWTPTEKNAVYDFIELGMTFSEAVQEVEKYRESVNNDGNK